MKCMIKISSYLLSIGFISLLALRSYYTIHNSSESIDLEKKHETKCCRILPKSVVDCRIIGFVVDGDFSYFFVGEWRRSIIFVVDSTFRWTPTAPPPVLVW